MYDLSYGVRLPAPRFCPQPISDLINNCFYERPNLRPDFEQIKYAIESAYSTLISKTIPINTSSDTKTWLNEAKNNDMKIRYTSVLKGNSNEEYIDSVTKSHIHDESTIPYPQNLKFNETTIESKNLSSKLAGDLNQS